MEGLHSLVTYLEQIANGAIVREKKDDEGNSVWSPLSSSNFTSTIGFGRRFFEKQNILEKCPNNLYDMPEHPDLVDNHPYVLQQTDLILQLASNDYAVNRLVLHNDRYLQFNKSKTGTSDSESLPLDLVGVLRGWARIIDVNSGFHRTDGRNLMGFYDGISNPDRLGSDFWISRDENPKYADGTFMVFQKIEHDLKQWGELDVQAQERWVGRSKVTGLLLGTVSQEKEKKLELDSHSSDPLTQKQALTKLARLVDGQRDPKVAFFDPYDARYYKISKNCPTSSHVRRANPRERQLYSQKGLIFRRGFLYMEEQVVDYPSSGLLFISFQKDIKIFETMQKNLASQKDHELKAGSRDANKTYALKESPSITFNTQNLGGGYYFIPPIPNKKISEIGKDFFNLHT